MGIVDELRAWLAAPSLDEDGEPYDLQLMPGMSAERIAGIERHYGCTFDPEVRELLAYCAGFEGGAMELVEFHGEPMDDLLPAMKGRFRSISPDGYGNVWFHWDSWVNARLGPVFYYMHEGPMLLYQCEGITDFVAEYLRFMRPPYDSLIDDVHEFRLRPIRALNDDLKTRDALIADAPELGEFAAGLPEDVSFRDFRNAKPGEGVDLAKLDVIALHPVFPVLAVRRRKTLAGRLAALFGSGR
jgi:hypothetical protein